MYTIRVTEINITDWLVLLRNIIIFIIIFNFFMSEKKKNIKYEKSIIYWFKIWK